MRHRIAPLALALIFVGSACSSKKDRDQDEAQPSQPAEPEPDVDAAPPKPAPLPKLAQPTTDSAPIAERGAVIATVQLPSGAAVHDLSAALDAVKPGTSALVRLQLPNLLGELAGMSLDGADLTRPLAIVVVDPGSHPSPAALLVTVDDIDELRGNANKAGRELREQGKLALIGPPDVVGAVESFAFANLASQPDHSEIVVYPQELVVALQPQIDAGLAQMRQAMQSAPSGPVGAQFIDIYAKAITGLSKQVDRVVISVSPSETSVDAFVRLYPVSGSTLAQFTAAQVPGGHTLLAKLPAGDGGVPPAVISGTMLAGASKDAILDWSLEFMDAMYQSSLDAEQWRAVLDPWIATLDGRFAMHVDMDFSNPAAPNMDMLGLVGTTDAEAMRTTWREMAKAMTQKPDGETPSAMGMKFDMQVSLDVLEHDGVPVDRFETHLDLEHLAPDQRAALEAAGTADQAMYFGAFDQVGALASADEDGAAIRGLIDAARGKTPTLTLPGDLGEAIATSQQHGESVVYYLNPRAIAPDVGAQIPFTSVVFAIGKHAEALSLRASLRK